MGRVRCTVNVKTWLTFLLTYVICLRGGFNLCLEQRMSMWVVSCNLIEHAVCGLLRGISGCWFAWICWSVAPGLCSERGIGWYLKSLHQECWQSRDIHCSGAGVFDRGKHGVWKTGCCC